MSKRKIMQGVINRGEEVLNELKKINTAIIEVDDIRVAARRAAESDMRMMQNMMGDGGHMALSNKPKAFCKECIYIKKDGWDTNDAICTHPDNIEVIETFYERFEKEKWKPRTKNRDNDCKLYTNKGAKKDKSKRGLLSIFKLHPDEGKLSIAEE